LFLAPAHVHAETWVKAKYVADGDTFVLEDDTLVRYIGVDAPEIDHQADIAEPYGYVARNFNKKLVLSSNLRLEYDQEKRDRFGRKLAYVFTENGVFVNQAVIERGYAFSLYSPPNLKYQNLLIKTQQQAMVSKKGIWKNWRDKSALYIGNSNSKRFHLPNCHYGKKTRPKNLVSFAGSWQAFWQGYAPCRQCLKTGDFYDP
jgi:micrococcal nuclease